MLGCRGLALQPAARVSERYVPGVPLKTDAASLPQEETARPYGTPVAPGPGLHHYQSNQRARRPHIYRFERN